tara:strand:+ start:419 stop:571 length:153 start_codon:yes stop_codon:yes gene_type:complete
MKAVNINMIITKDNSNLDSNAVKILTQNEIKDWLEGEGFDFKVEFIEEGL